MAIIKKTDIYNDKDVFKSLQAEIDALIASNKKLQKSFVAIKKTNDGSEAKELTKLTKQLDTATNKLTISETNYAKELAEVKVKQQQVNKENKIAAQNKLNLGSAYEKESRKLNNLRKEYKELAIQNKQNTKEGKKLLANLTKLDKKLKAVDNAVGQNQRSVGKYTNALKGLGKNLIGSLGVIGGFTALISVVKDAFKIFTQFSKSSSKLAAILGKNKNEIKSLTEQAKLLGSTTAFTASEVVLLQTELAKLGFSLKEIENSTPGILDLAAATGTDLAQSAELAGATLRIFNLDASEMQRVTDVLAKSTTVSSLSMEKLATILPTVGKTAQLAGVSLEKTAALAGTLTDRGLDASSAATSLRNIFLELSKKGITWQEAMEKINSATDKNKASMDLFGKRAAAAGVILAETKTDVDKLTSSLNNSNGAAKEMADTMLNNLSGDIIKASSAWEGFVLSLESGNGVISSVMRKATQYFTTFLTTLSQLNNGISLFEIRAKKTSALTEGLAKDNEKYIKSLKDLKTNEEKTNYVNSQAISIKHKLRGVNYSLNASEEKLKDIQGYRHAFAIKEKTELRKKIKQLKFEQIAYNEKLKLLEKLKPIDIDNNKEIKENTNEIIKNTTAVKKNNAAKNQKTFASTGQADIVSPVSGISANAEDFELSAHRSMLKQKADMDAIYQANVTTEAKNAEAVRNEEIINQQNALDAQRLELISTAENAAVGLVKDIFNVGQQEKISQLQDSANAEVQILQDKLDKGEITEAEFQERSDEIKKKERIKEAKIQKKMAIFGIGVDTAVAIVKALALGMPFLIPGIIAEGAIQAAAVAATPIPKFEKGGKVKGERHSKGGTIIEAERDEYIISRNGYKGAEKITELINKGLLKDNDINLMKNNNYSLESFKLNGLIEKFEESKKQQIETNRLLSNLGISYENKGMIYIKLANGQIIKINKNDY